MKKVIVGLMLGLSLVVTGCQRVQPNHVGVLETNCAKNGKSDFEIVSGRVNTMGLCTHLYTVPLYEQRGGFGQTVTLKSSDNTEFVVKPVYSYRVTRDRSIDVVFDNRQVSTSDSSELATNKDAFLTAIETNILNPKIVDMLRTQVASMSSEALMGNGGNAKFNDIARGIVTKEFESRGFKLISFSVMLEPSARVKVIIDERNQAETQVSTINSKVEQAKKQLELESIQSQIKLERSKGLTQAYLTDKFIDKWDGKTPLYGNTPVSVLIQQK